MNDILAQSIRNIQRAGSNLDEMAKILSEFYSIEDLKTICDKAASYIKYKSTLDIKDRILTYSRGYCTIYLNKHRNGGPKYKSAWANYLGPSYAELLYLGELKHPDYSEDFLHNLKGSISRSNIQSILGHNKDYYISFETKRKYIAERGIYGYRDDPPYIYSGNIYIYYRKKEKAND